MSCILRIRRTGQYALISRISVGHEAGDEDQRGLTPLQALAFQKAYCWDTVIGTVEIKDSNCEENDPTMKKLKHAIHLYINLKDSQMNHKRIALYELFSFIYMWPLNKYHGEFESAARRRNSELSNCEVIIHNISGVKIQVLP